MAKRPSFQFYPADWLRDPHLRSCSLAARGLWMDMLCYMHDSAIYGHLIVGTTPVDASRLSRMVGTTAPEAAELLKELLEANVCEMNADGVIFSRRMVRDDHIRQTNSKNGAAAWTDSGARRSLVKGGHAGGPIVRPDSQGESQGEIFSDSDAKTKEPARRAPEEEDEEEVEGGSGGGVRGGGMDEFGEPTWRTRQPRRIPEDFFATRSMRAKARAKGIEHDGFLDWETDKLINWAINASGAKGAKTDWSRAWLNWIMRAIEDGEYERWKRRSGGSGPGTGARPAGGGANDPYSPESIAARRKKRDDGEGSDS